MTSQRKFITQDKHQIFMEKMVHAIRFSGLKEDEIVPVITHYLAYIAIDCQISEDDSVRDLSACFRYSYRQMQEAGYTVIKKEKNETK